MSGQTALVLYEDLSMCLYYLHNHSLPLPVFLHVAQIYFTVSTVLQAHW